MGSTRNGKVIESYDKIYEYKINKDGSITVRTPAYEVREIESGKVISHAAFFTYPDGKVYKYSPRDEFWDPTHSIDLFRFKTGNDAENRKVIADELQRRIDSFRKHADEYTQKADRLTKIVSNL